MPKHRITVTQSYNVTRTIHLWVEDETHEGALEQVSSGSIDLPDPKDPKWREGWDLQNEEYE